MEGIMREKDFQRISFASHNTNFEIFYQGMTDIMENLSGEQNLFSCLKIISTFICTYRYGVVNEDTGDEIDKMLVKLTDELLSDSEIQKMVKYDQQNIDIELQYTQKYYYYFHKMLKLFGFFLESLDQTLMPTTYQKGKKLRYSYNIPFYYCYSGVKKIISENLNTFTIEKFIKPINSIIIFFYAYRAFVTEDIRKEIEEIIKLIIVIISDNEFLKVVRKEIRGSKEQQELNEIKNKLYVIILKVYAKINEEHSRYDLNPKVIKKVYIDSTGI